MSDIAVSRFYEPWALFNERLIEAIRPLDDAQLALRASPEHGAVWQLVAHTAGARVYWLCARFGEPCLEPTPFVDLATGEGWEDRPEEPRSALELVEALETSWRVVAGCLDRWTPEQLFEQFAPQADKRTLVKTRQGVIVRLLSHDAYHAGEISQTLGVHGLEPVDLWRAD
jgi:uncharacterized damage-inducible protein DinB